MPKFIKLRNGTILPRDHVFLTWSAAMDGLVKFPECSCVEAVMTEHEDLLFFVTNPTDDKK